MPYKNYTVTGKGNWAGAPVSLCFQKSAPPSVSQCQISSPRPALPAALMGAFHVIYVVDVEIVVRYLIDARTDTNSIWTKRRDLSTSTTHSNFWVNTSKWVCMGSPRWPPLNLHGARRVTQASASTPTNTSLDCFSSSLRILGIMFYDKLWKLLNPVVQVDVWVITLESPCNCICHDCHCK